MNNNNQYKINQTNTNILLKPKNHKSLKKKKSKQKTIPQSRLRKKRFNLHKSTISKSRSSIWNSVKSRIKNLSKKKKKNFLNLRKKKKNN